MKKERLKKFLLNPWTIALGGALFSFALSFLGDSIRGEKLFSTFVLVITWVWDVIFSFLTFELKAWWVLLGIVVIFFGLWIYFKILDAKQSTPQEPLFLSYTQDDILGYRFEWEWKKDYSGKYGADNIRPICTKCGTPLVREYHGMSRFKCLRCDKQYQKSYPDEGHVKMMIHDNVRIKFFSEKEEN